MGIKKLLDLDLNESTGRNNGRVKGRKGRMLNKNKQSLKVEWMHEGRSKYRYVGL